MSDNEYSSYLSGISYTLDKFDSIIVDGIMDKYNQAIDLRERKAYGEVFRIIKKFTKDLKEQRRVGFR